MWEYLTKIVVSLIGAMASVFSTIYRSKKDTSKSDIAEPIDTARSLPAADMEPNREARRYSDWLANLCNGGLTVVIDCRQRSDIEDLQRVVGNYLNENLVSEDSIDDVWYAINELCSNVALHSSNPHGRISIYPGLGNLTIDICAKSEGNAFCLKDSLNKYPVDSKSVLNHGLVALHSLGYLSHSYSDEVNTVTFRKHLTPVSNVKCEDLKIHCQRDLVILDSVYYTFESWARYVVDTVELIADAKKIITATDGLEGIPMTLERRLHDIVN